MKTEDEAPATSKPTTTTPATSKPKEQAKASTKTYVVIARKGLNIRKAPSATSAKIGALKYGTKIEVTKEEKGFVKLANRDGWCCIGSKGVKYLKLKK